MTNLAIGHNDSELRAPMSAYAKTAIAAALGIGLGLAATWLTTGHSFLFGAAQSGPWIAWPKTGASDADPYERAIIARQAEAPLANGEGIVFVAREDSAGAPLDGACDYSIEGAFPVARLWTVALYAPTGALAPAAAGRREVTSSTALRSQSGEADIIIAPSVRAGNWLAGPKGKQFAIAMTLYDAAASPTQTSLSALSMPRVRKGECQ